MKAINFLTAAFYAKTAGEQAIEVDRYERIIFDTEQPATWDAPRSRHHFHVMA